MDQRSLKSQDCLLFFHQMLLGSRGVSLSRWKVRGLFISAETYTERTAWSAIPTDGVGRGMGRGEPTDASPLAGIPRSPGSTCSTLHTLFPQPIIENRAFDCKPFSPAFEFLSAPCGCYQFTNKEKLKLVYELLLLYPSSAIC